MAETKRWEGGGLVLWELGDDDCRQGARQVRLRNNNIWNGWKMVASVHAYAGRCPFSVGGGGRAGEVAGLVALIAVFIIFERCVGEGRLFRSGDRQVSAVICS